VAPSTSVPTWTDDELRETFGGPGWVFARDGRANSTALPHALLDGDARTSDVGTWSAQVGQLHPDDRAASVRVWWEAVEHPGELHALDVRARDRDHWRLYEIRYLNLLHQPGVRAVLVKLLDRGEAPSDVVGELDPSTPVDLGPPPIWVVQELDQVGIIHRSDGMVEELFGVTADELVGRNILDFVHHDDADSAVSMWLELMDTQGSTRVMRQRIVRPDGHWTWIESTVMNRLADESVRAVVAVSLDISERYQQEAALRASQEEFRTLAEEVPAAVFRADPHGRVTFANARWYYLASFCGSVESLIDLVALDHRTDWGDRWAAFTQTDGPETMAFEFPSSDGARVLAAHCRRVHSDGSSPSFIGVLSDVTDTAELRRRADHDSLTGLLNREAFDRALATALADDLTRPVVAFVDLDDFKWVNDELGHEAGDHVLTEVGRRLQECIRPGDEVARYGGDEFVVFCHAVPRGREPSLHQRITDALATPVRWRDHQCPLHASVGVARAEDDDRVVDVVRRADTAMYEHKRSRGPVA
jgi:diguanylate cyclase (GGDEF)-like protein/PAS domain S-box-containing protein